MGGVPLYPVPPPRSLVCTLLLEMPHFWVVFPLVLGGGGCGCGVEGPVPNETPSVGWGWGGRETPSPPPQAMVWDLFCFGVGTGWQSPPHNIDDSLTRVCGDPERCPHPPAPPTPDQTEDAAAFLALFSLLLP